MTLSPSCRPSISSASVRRPTRVPVVDQLIELSSSDDELLEPCIPLERSWFDFEPLTFPEPRLLPDDPMPEEPEPDEPDRPSDWLLPPLALREESLTFELLELPSPEPREPEAPIEPPSFALPEPRFVS